MERRLAAILVADMVGYSRLISEDESGTLARLRTDRADLIDPAIARHGGEIIRLAGDGALIEFPSVVEAVQCAVDIQRGMAERNAERPEPQRIVFRMGVNLGDIVIEPDNLHGEGINVAARLEAMAPPGGILTTEEIARHVDGKVSARLEFVGKRTVKNIDHPIQVYRVQTAGTASRPRCRGARIRWHWYAGVIAVLGVGIVAAVYLAPQILIQQPALQEPSSEPSLIVLPFRNLSND
jgi:adenylate cyclase